MALTGIKYDDGSGILASGCFPVRGLIRQAEEGNGAWLTAHQAEQRRQFKALLCAKPITYDDIKEQRRKIEKGGGTIEPPPLYDEVEDDDKILDGFFLMKHCCVEDPEDLCSVNISGQNLNDIKQDDFALFDNVAYVNATENILPFEPFKYFPIIRELELPLNAVRGIQVRPGDFPYLEMLDLSYNNLSPEDLLPLGLIPNLKVLHVTGNGLKTLPKDLAKPHTFEDSDIKIARFQKLEILMLDDNRLSDLTTFAAVAGIKRLQHLNLSKNQIYSVPQLMVVDGRHVSQDSIELKYNKKKISRKSARKSARKSRTASPLKGILRNSPIKDISKGISSVKISPELNAEGEIKAGKVFNIADEVEGASTGGVSKKKDEDVTQKKEAEVPVEDILQPKESDDSLAFEDFGGLNLNALDDKIEAEIKEKEGRLGMKSSSDNTLLPPPFPELAYLNLSYNHIRDEDGLLAVAAWPMLSELIIHNNPLTLENSGDPPLLKAFLTDRLGIHITRLKPGPLQKPNIEVQVKPERKVNSHVPKILKRNVDDIIMSLENSVKTPALTEGPSTQPQTQSGFTPHPPSSSRPSSRPSLSSRSSSLISPRPQTPVSRQLPPLTVHNLEAVTAPDEEFKGDAFFMTQLDDPAGEKKDAGEPKEEVHPPSAKKNNRKKVKNTKSKGYENYVGYEALLDVDDLSDEDDMPIPRDIQGNVRALQFTLSHELVFRDNNVKLDELQKPFRLHVRAKEPEQKKRKNKEERIEELLNHLREQNTVKEAPLKSLLEDRAKMKANFPETNTLLNQIQDKYNMVRTTSMQEAKESKHFAQDVLQDIQSMVVK